ncbi:hypothetical protein MNBD_ALPHA06-1230 [hydrothermal vent metagenome]|uniref:Uncharacterized protein n=1 Tax=hydrothermal vent metagenome TaxID=652676 RepID=A0A3B0SC75_9ZZZZ
MRAPILAGASFLAITLAFPGFALASPPISSEGSVSFPTNDRSAARRETQRPRQSRNNRGNQPRISGGDQPIYSPAPPRMATYNGRSGQSGRSGGHSSQSRSHNGGSSSRSHNRGSSSRSHNRGSSSRSHGRSSRQHRGGGYNRSRGHSNFSLSLGSRGHSGYGYGYGSGYGYGYGGGYGYASDGGHGYGYGGGHGYGGGYGHGYGGGYGYGGGHGYGGGYGYGRGSSISLSFLGGSYYQPGYNLYPWWYGNADYGYRTRAGYGSGYGHVGHSNVFCSDPSHANYGVNWNGNNNSDQYFSNYSDTTDGTYGGYAVNSCHLENKRGKFGNRSATVKATVCWNETARKYADTGAVQLLNYY